MKKTALMLSLCLGFLLVSCEKDAKVNNKTPEKQTNKEVVKTKPVKREVTKHPDTIIDGVRIYNFKSESAKERVVSIDEAINMFESGVEGATNCEDLIKACVDFDSNMKKICAKDKNLSIGTIEKREDVRAIRRISEEKSLKLCQTQQVR